MIQLLILRSYHHLIQLLLLQRMGLIYVLLSLLTQPKKKVTSFSKRYLHDDGMRKHMKDVFSQRIRFWGSKRQRRKMKGKKELPIFVEALREASPNMQEPKSDVLENIQNDPKSAKQVHCSEDKYRSDKEIDHTSLNVNTFVGYVEPVQVPSTFDLHESLIRQLQEFKYCKMSPLNDGFFAFKFPTEDQEILVLEHGQLLIDNKPLILKRWSPSIDLVPTIFLSAIPIWVRFYNLNWVYWNRECLSKISSIIGVPLFMDRCTATMTRLDYARVCIEVNANKLRLPDTVHMLRNGTIIPVPVEYEWKPLQCEICLSIYHDSGTCTFIGVGKLSAEFLQQSNATQGTPFRPSYDEDGVDTISVSSGPQFEESSIEGNLDDALQERALFLEQNP